METTQYKTHVTQEMRDLIAAIAELGADMIDNLSRDKYDAPQIDPIEGDYRSGWLPSQDGGLCASYLADNGWGSGSFLCALHEEQVREQEEGAYAAMAHDLPDVSPDSDEAGEYLIEYMREPMLVYFEVFWEKDGGLSIRHGWNFRDAPYYREKHADDLRSVTFAPDELIGKNAAQLFAEYCA